MRTRDQVAFAARLLHRQWRAGELRLMASAALLAVTLATLLAVFGDRLERALVSRAADLLGADLVLAAGSAPGDRVLAAARRAGIASSRVVDFSTMATTAGDDALLLVAVRAADDAYPLRGELRTGEPGADRVANAGPARGEAWIDTGVRDQLGIGPGDSIGIGRSMLRVGAILTQEPDRSADFGSLSPHVLMNIADLEATGVVQPGSRVRWRTLFAGTAGDLARFRPELERLREPQEEILDVHGGSRRSANALSRAEQALALAGALGVVLCGAALGIAADRQSRRLYDTVALLRAFGMARAVVWRILALQTLLLAVMAGAGGVLAGLLLQAALVALLGDVLPAALPAPGIVASLAGLAAALVAIPAFTLPPLARLADVSPLRALRRDLAPASRGVWLQYALGIALLVALLALLARDRLLALSLLGGIAALVALSLPLASLLLGLLRQLRARLPFAARLAADRLAHTPWRFGAQVVAFALILASMTLAALVRDDILGTWQRQIPADAPDLFAMNLLPGEEDRFREHLAARGIAPPTLYPVTPGRLQAMDGAPFMAALDPGARGAHALERDLVLTTAALLPPDNDITEGDWWPARAGPGLVSVEAELAEQLGIRPGAELTFLVAGQEIRARVTSLRRLEWDSFRPNFFMVFSPGTLDEAPHTWLTSFHAGGDPALLRELRAAFPAITLLETGPLLARLDAFVQVLARGVGFVLLLLFGCAALLLVAAVQSTLDERLAESALLRVLGARRALLRRTLLAEFALLGALSGLLALAATEVARWQLYTRLLDLPWSPLPLLWLSLPPLAAGALALLGYLSARRSLAADAGAVLRDA